MKVRGREEEGENDREVRKTKREVEKKGVKNMRRGEEMRRAEMEGEVGRAEDIQRGKAEKRG